MEKFNFNQQDKVLKMEYCQFCMANGESELQYRTHQVKNSSGLVSCPVLRKYVCPYCKATGDFAHTQRYCPLNKDGKLSPHGASLIELKRKKNAAGNYPNHPNKKMMWSENVPDKNNYSSLLKSKSAGAGDRYVAGSPPTRDIHKKNPLHDAHHHSPVITEPLPSGMRPVTPPPVLQYHQQPECTQLTMYRHYQYLQYYR